MSAVFADAVAAVRPSLPRIEIFFEVPYFLAVVEKERAVLGLNLMAAAEVGIGGARQDAEQFLETSFKYKWVRAGCGIVPRTSLENQVNRALASSLTASKRAFTNMVSAATCQDIWGGCLRLEFLV